MNECLADYFGVKNGANHSYYQNNHELEVEIERVVKELKPHATCVENIFKDSRIITSLAEHDLKDIKLNNAVKITKNLLNYANQFVHGEKCSYEKANNAFIDCQLAKKDMKTSNSLNKVISLCNKSLKSDNTKNHCLITTFFHYFEKQLELSSLEKKCEQNKLKTKTSDEEFAVYRDDLFIKNIEGSYEVANLALEYILPFAMPNIKVSTFSIENLLMCLAAVTHRLNSLKSKHVSKTQSMIEEQKNIAERDKNRLEVLYFDLIDIFRFKISYRPLSKMLHESNNKTWALLLVKTQIDFLSEVDHHTHLDDKDIDLQELWGYKIDSGTNKCDFLFLETSFYLLSLFSEHLKNDFDYILQTRSQKIIDLFSDPHFDFYAKKF